MQWSYRILNNADHEYVRRATEAVEWLSGLAARSSNVAAVTHGGFRRILDARLVSRGWAPFDGAQLRQLERVVIPQDARTLRQSNGCVNSKETSRM